MREPRLGTHGPGLWLAQVCGKPGQSRSPQVSGSSLRRNRPRVQQGEYVLSSHSSGRGQDAVPPESRIRVSVGIRASVPRGLLVGRDLGLCMEQGTAWRLAFFSVSKRGQVRWKSVSVTSIIALFCLWELTH